MQQLQGFSIQINILVIIRDQLKFGKSTDLVSAKTETTLLKHLLAVMLQCGLMTSSRIVEASKVVIFTI